MNSKIRILAAEVADWKEKHEITGPFELGQGPGPHQTAARPAEGHQSPIRDPGRNRNTAGTLRVTTRRYQSAEDMLAALETVDESKIPSFSSRQ
jgi:hypothetical protein